MSDHEPLRIVGEVVSSADVKRLEARDDDLRALIKSQADKIDGLHRTIYELMEVISKLRGKW